jgi:5-methyltetrahydropteroyltriglutamate--homocysteine methyltransferase
MSRIVLDRLGISLPALPATSVGSLPKPPELLAARAKFARGTLDQRSLDELAEEATLFWLQRQEDIGLDVLVDGETYRGDMVAYFAEAFDGMALGGLLRSYGNRYYRKPVITGPVCWQQPITVGWWQFAQRHSSRPIKAIVTGPYTMMDWSFDEHYPDRRSACLALAIEVRKEVEALVRAGARIVQLDEPALSARPAELPLALEATQIVIEGLDAYFVTHACYGAFETIYPNMLNLLTHNLDLAISQSAIDWVRVFQRDPFRKDLSVGVVDVHSHEVEEEESIRVRIRAALELVRADRLWVSPDCGLKTRTVEEASAKLRVMVDAVRALRIELAAAVEHPA